jgi:hypothetical protein
MCRQSILRICLFAMVAAAIIIKPFYAHAATPGKTEAIVTVAQAATLHLGTAPSLPKGSQRTLEFTLVGMEPGSDVGFSIVVLLRPSPGAKAVEAGHVAPYPLSRIDPNETSRYQSFVLNIDNIVPAAGGGDWEVELHMESSTMDNKIQQIKLRFARIQFGRE